MKFSIDTCTRGRARVCENHFFIEVIRKPIAQALRTQLDSCRTCSLATSAPSGPLGLGCTLRIAVLGQCVSTYTRAAYSTLASANDSRLGLAS